MTPEQLKNSILQYAIQGKLVEQRKEEGTVEELYKKIQEEKLKLIKEGKIKKQKELPEITEDEIPFDIPESWKWVRLGDLGEVFRGASPRPIKDYITNDINGINWIKIGDTNKNSKYLENIKEKITITGKLKSRFVEKGTLLLTNSMSFGEAYILNVDGCIHDGWLAIIDYENYIYKDFLYYILKSNFMYNEFCKTVSGAVVKNLSTDKVKYSIIPLPPLEEQKRIVAKIEELLPLVDDYAKAYEELEKLNVKFPEDIKKSILQHAIQGKLVEQRKEEGTAEELYKSLLDEKQKLEENGKILKKGKTNPLYSEEELKEFDIPETWRWAQLSDVSIIQEGAGIRKWQYRDFGMQVLCVTNILEGSIDTDKKKLYISDEEYKEKYIHLSLNEGDIVTSCSGGSWGKISFYNVKNKMILNTSTLRMRFFSDLANNKYLYYICKSQFFKKQLILQMSGMQPNFGYSHYSRIMIPLPPLDEQKRIVDKIEKLLSICEKFKLELHPKNDFTF